MGASPVDPAARGAFVELVVGAADVGRHAVTRLLRGKVTEGNVALPAAHRPLLRRQGEGPCHLGELFRQALADHRQGPDTAPADADRGRG